MSFFESIGRRFHRCREKQRISARFGNYADASLVDSVLSKANGMEPPSKTRIDFVLLLVADNDLDRVSEYLADAVNVLFDSGGFCDSKSGSLVSAMFKVVLPNRDPRSGREQREAAVSQLYQRLGDNVRIVHGNSAAVVGDLLSAKKYMLSNFGFASIATRM